MPEARYRRRTVEVTAVRWTGQNEAQLAAFAGPGRFMADPGCPELDMPPTVGVLLSRHANWADIEVGDFVVKDDAGNLELFGASDFTDDFELVAS